MRQPSCELSLSLPSGRHARGGLRIQKIPFLFVSGTFGANHGFSRFSPVWLRVAACPVGELRESAAEVALQASDVGAVADALEPFEHQRRILAVLPDLFVKS
jgi:hypothetical protein